VKSLQIGYLKENQSAKDQSDLDSLKTKYLWTWWGANNECTTGATEWMRRKFGKQGFYDNGFVQKKPRVQHVLLHLLSVITPAVLSLSLSLSRKSLPLNPNFATSSPPLSFRKSFLAINPILSLSLPSLSCKKFGRHSQLKICHSLLLPSLVRNLLLNLNSQTNLPLFLPSLVTNLLLTPN
jgi:hypothetical protein